jgi:hypothetical protein
VAFKPTARYLSAYRIYPENKTSSGRERRWQELTSILEGGAGKEYAAVFQRVIHKRDSILRLRKIVRDLHLSRFDPVTFRVAFPDIFSRYPPREIWNMIESIGYN